MGCDPVDASLNDATFCAVCVSGFWKATSHCWKSLPQFHSWGPSERAASRGLGVNCLGFAFGTTSDLR